MNKVFTFIFCIMFAMSASASTPPVEAQSEIEHLLKFISGSSCQFMRNGTWYAASDAAEHINKKYRYVLKRGLVETAEDFIRYSATKSSMSGKTYKVKCDESMELDSADWLQAELDEYRKQNN